MKHILFLLFMLTSLSAHAAETTHGVALRPQLMDGQADLLAENVSIKLGSEQAFIRAHYIITNPTEREQQLDVGFPMLYDRELGVTSIKVGDKLTRLRQLPAVLTNKEEKHPILWRYWMMTLPPKQEVTFHIKTMTESDNEIAPTLSPYLQHRTAIWKEFTTNKQPLPNDIEDHLKKMISMNTGYAARFNQWSKPVKSMTISIRNADKIRSASPPHGELTGDTWRWRFEEENQKPAFFHIEYNPYLSLSQEIALAKLLSKRHPNSKSLKSYHQYLAALQNKRM